MHLSPLKQEYINHHDFKLNLIDYKKGSLVGAGGYGDVITCVNVHNGHTVAVKKSKKGENDSEAAVLGKLMLRNFDRYNIVKFYGCHNLSSEKVLVFEKLDMDLYRYLSDQKPMMLRDIKNIIRQTATALTALQCMGLIHCDLKPDNIMIVDRQQSPISVKLIDFGLARYKSEVRQGMLLQVPPYRSPEIVLGLPITEGIDMWALGCIMARMISGMRLFNVKTEEELLRSIVELLGQPKDHLLDNGIKTKMYFNKMGNFNKWILKKPENPPKENSTPQKHLYLQSLDDLKTFGLESDKRAESGEREQCVELLEAMLEVDPHKRITPIRVLTHPFIYSDDTSSESASLRTDSMQPSESCCLTFTSITDSEPEDTSATTIVRQYQLKSCKSLRIKVRPATPWNTLDLEDDESEDSFQITLKKASESSLQMNRTITLNRFVESTSDESNWTKETQRKQRKKHRVSYFLSRMKKIFCCYWTGKVVEW